VPSFVLPGPGPDWQAEIAARNVARHEESLRVIAHYKERDRQREEREAAEARAENERQIELRRRQGWPI
jgi:glucose-6-phosphate dehydrogenase assembly protein OpcA